MNLSDFCSLVANLPAPESGATRSMDEEARLEEIRGCFTPAESDQSLRKAVDFLADLGIRHLKHPIHPTLTDGRPRARGEQ